MLEAYRKKKKDMRQEHLGSGGKAKEIERGEHERQKRLYRGESLKRAESVCSFYFTFDQKSGKPLSSDVSDHHTSTP